MIKISIIIAIGILGLVLLFLFSFLGWIIYLLLSGRGDQIPELPTSPPNKNLMQ